MSEFEPPIRKILCTPAALPHLGFAKNKLLALDAARRASGNSLAKKAFELDDVVFILSCSDDSRAIIALGVTYQLYDMRSLTWPVFSGIGDGNAAEVLTDLRFIARLKHNPGASFDPLGEDYVTFENCFPAMLPETYEAGEFTGVDSYDYDVTAGFWGVAMIARSVNRLCEDASGPYLCPNGGGTVLSLVLLRGLTSTRDYPLTGNFDPALAEFGGRQYKYLHACFQIPTGHDSSGTWIQDPSHVGHFLHGSAGSKVFRELPLLRSYTEIETGGAAGCAPNDLGLNLYYHERDSAGTWYPRLLTFGPTLELVRDIPLQRNFLCRKIRGRVGADPKGTIAVKAFRDDVYILGMVGTGGPLSLTGTPWLAKIDKAGVQTWVQLTPPDGFTVADFAIGAGRIFILVHRMDTETSSFVDDITGQWGTYTERYAVKCTAQICSIPLDMSSGTMTWTYSEDYWCGCKVYRESPPDPPVVAADTLRVMFPTLATTPGKPTLMYFARPDGFIHCPPTTVPVNPEVNPVVSTSGAHPYQMIIKTLFVGGTPDVPVLTVVDTAQSGITHAVGSVPGGIIGASTTGLFFGRGINEKYL